MASIVVEISTEHRPHPPEPNPKQICGQAGGKTEKELTEREAADRTS